MPEFLQEWVAKFGDIPVWLVVLGLVGQVVFFTRFLVQWIASERAGRSVVPVSFWWISIVGSFVLLGYAILRADPVIILGQSFGSIVYTRNLVLIRRTSQQAAGAAP